MKTVLSCRLGIAVLLAGAILASVDGQPAEAIGPVSTIVVVDESGLPASGARFGITPRVPQAHVPKDYTPLQTGHADVLGHATIEIPVNDRTVALAASNGGFINLYFAAVNCRPGDNYLAVSADRGIAVKYDEAAAVFRLADDVGEIVLRPAPGPPSTTFCNSGGGGSSSCFPIWSTDDDNVADYDGLMSIAEAHTPNHPTETSLTQVEYGILNKAETKFGTVIEMRDPETGYTYVEGSHTVANAKTDGSSTTKVWPRFGYRSSTVRLGMHIVKALQSEWCYYGLGMRATGRSRYVSEADHWNGPMEHGEVELSDVDTLANMQQYCNDPFACRTSLFREGDNYIKHTGEVRHTGVGIKFFGTITWAQTKYNDTILRMTYLGQNGYSGSAFAWCPDTYTPPPGTRSCTDLDDGPVIYQAYQP